MGNKIKQTYFKSKKISKSDFKKAFKVRLAPDFVNVFDSQIKELYEIEQHRNSSVEPIEKYQKVMQSKFNYFYYPWINKIVKTVNEEYYYELVTNRNRNLITEDEQYKLRNYKIAVLGMSVGSNIALTLAQSGISQEMTIADFDTLETTNLNRIRAGINDIGMNKAEIISQKIYEGNPYAKINVINERVTEKILEELIKSGKVDCIVEEIDDVFMKIATRKVARKYMKPVLMVTDNGDRAVLHIERYDLGYKKIFDKDDNYWTHKLKKVTSKKDFANIIINDILGGSHHVDPKMMKSVPLVSSGELVSWPQLATSAILGGVAATVAIKNILRDQHQELYQIKYLKI